MIGINKAGIPPRNINGLAYQGAALSLLPVISLPRNPTTSDNQFPLNTFAINIDENDADYGSLWYLSYFDAQVSAESNAIWIKLGDGSSGPLINIDVPLGSSPVLPDGAGTITYTSTAGTLAITGSTNAINFDLTGGGIGVDSFTVPAGTSPVVPNASGNIAITAGTGITVTGGLNTYQIASTASLTDLHGPKFIVGDTANGANYSTIASAITAASSGDTVFIQARSTPYTENLTLKAGVNLVGLGSDGIAAASGTPISPNVTILGTCTASFTGNVVCSGIQFKTNGAAAIATSGSVGQLIFVNCSVFANDATGMTFNAGSTGTTFYSCCFNNASSNALFAVTTGAIQFNQCSVLLSSAAASTLAVSTVAFNACSIQGLTITTSTTGSVNCYNSSWGFSGQTLLTMAGTGTSTIYNSSLLSGLASALSIGAGCTANLSNTTVSSENTNALTGAGILVFSCVSFVSSSSLVNTTTQTSKPVGPRLDVAGSINSFPPLSSTALSNVNTAVNAAIRGYMECTTGASAAGFGCSLELHADNAANENKNVCGLSGVYTTTTTSSEVSYGQVTVLSGGSNVASVAFLPQGLAIGANTGLQVTSGAGSPNGSITAPQGSLYLRTDGSGVNDRMYVNTDSSTAWTAVVTVA